MTKTFLFILGISLMTSFVSGQTRQRVFDNFDTVNGVQIYKPTVAELPAVTPKSKGSVKKTTQTISTKTSPNKTNMGVQEGLALKNNALITTNVSYNKLVMGNATGLNGFTTGDSTIDSYIVEFSRRYNIDPLLIYAQMHQESGFKVRATSYKGASGLMQLMPATARRFGVTSIYDPKQNVEAGIKYMRWLLDTFNGDIVLALAGYNAGEGAVWKYGNQVPPYRETQEYVRRITTRYKAISNPDYVKSVRQVTQQQVAKLEQKEARPLTVYEPTPIVIKTPDGRMRLVNQ